MGVIYQRDDIDIARFLPPVSRDSLDIQEIMKAENPEFLLMWEIMLDILDNQFIPTMGEYGLSQWESIFDVAPLESDTIDDRRRRILGLLAGTRPYTLEKLQEILDITYGPNQVRAELDGDTYELWFTLSKEMQARAREIIEYTEPIVPKNLLLRTLVEELAKGMVYGGGRTVYCETEITVRRSRINDISTNIHVGGRLVHSTVELIRR